MRRRSRGALWTALLVTLVATALAGTTGVPTSAGGRGDPPSIVMIHLDDVSTDLVGSMPELERLMRDSARFRYSFVADSLCCTSRATTFTGQYPHNTRVRTNDAGPDPDRPEGGWAAFTAYGNEAKSFNVALHDQAPRRYHTALTGKYVNAFTPEKGVPRGWSSFRAVLSDGYEQYGYTMTENARDDDGRRVLSTRRFGHRPQDYGTTVQTRQALRMIAKRKRVGRPYYLQLSTYAAHGRMTELAPGEPRFLAAPQDRPGGTRVDGNCGLVACGSLDVRRLPGYDDPALDNAAVTDDGARVAWRPDRALTPAHQARLDAHLRDRAQMVQAVDRMIGRVRRAIDDDTYLVVTSDNGFRLGQFRLPNGKATPYDADIRVPLVVSGPGVVPGDRDQVVSNVDLASTFEDVAGVRPRFVRDGSSFLDVLRDPSARGNRVAFVEHQRPTPAAGDPDKETSTRLVPSYLAARTPDALLVRYDLDPGPGTRTAWEFYRGLSRPGAFERTNVYDPTDPTVRRLAQRLADFDGCRGETCRAAAR